MNVLPPDLLNDTKATAKPQKFDRKEFYPSSLVPDEAQEFRLLGVYSTGNAGAYWRFPTETIRNGELGFSGFKYVSEYPGEQPEGIARKVNWASPGREKIEDEFVTPKQALVWTVWSYARQRVELMIIEQRGLKESIQEILSEADDYTFDEKTGVANFLLKLTRKGTGKDTSYSVIPKIKKTETAIAKAFAEVADTAQVEKLLTGGHPMLEATSFNSGGSDDDEGEF